MVGASFTEYSIYPQHILDLSVRDPFVLLKFVGSRGPGNKPPTGELRHEGYSGWTAQAFATLTGPLSRSVYHKRPQTGSPFAYEDGDGQVQLDFDRYCQEFNQGQGPDFVTIQVGINDTFTATDETIDSRIDTMLRFYDQLIEMIRRHRPRTRIGCNLVTPPAASQDGFRNYRGPGKQTRWQCRRNQHRLIERMIERYQHREQESIFLVPTNINLDVVHNFPKFRAPINARSSAQIDRINNGTHPDTAGYQQIGDSIYSWIKG
jgi:lysophospholipase L1-like esterase